MWSGAIHDTEFVTKALEHVEANESLYGTVKRMKGMLTVAKEVCPSHLTIVSSIHMLTRGYCQELHTPFYFTPSKVAGNFHCVCPPLDDVAYVNYSWFTVYEYN